MVSALLVGAAAVLAAAVPGVLLTAQDLSAAQDRVDTARLATRAAALAHDLADERDGLAVRAAARAAGRLAAGGAGPAAADRDRTDRDRTDRQAADIRPGAPADLRAALDGLPAVRQRALAGTGGPQGVLTAYQPLVDALARVAGPATAPLGRAVNAASVQRGLLTAALTGSDGGRRALATAAQAARVQEQAELGDFRATATAALRDRYDRTVTGPAVTAADRELAELFDGARPGGSDQDLGADRVSSSLTGRIDLMRSVEASAAADGAASAAARSTHDMTVLGLTVGIAVLCLLLLLGTLGTLFRAITRPLAALHRWSGADTDSGQSAEVIGTGEFAAVARRVNALTHEARALRARMAELTAERENLLRTQDDLLRSREELVGRLAAATAQNTLQLTFVNLGLRTLGLVERQLTLIDGLEGHEQDPDRLETLFRLDHLATRMRRNSENLLVLTGTEHSHGAAACPVLLVDVARAAISEIERYERVRIQSVPEVLVAGRAADDIGHLIAELLDNATAFSAPTAEIQLTGRVLENGEIMLSVEDTGIGVPPERIDALNALLADPDPAPPGAVSGMGLYVVARLAHRHGVRVQVRPRGGGGTAAVVVLPRLLLPVASTGASGEPPGTPVETAPAGDGGRVPGPRAEQTAPGSIAPARFERVARRPAPAAGPGYPGYAEHLPHLPHGDGQHGQHGQHGQEHVPHGQDDPQHVPHAQHVPPPEPGPGPVRDVAPEAVEHARPAVEPRPRSTDPFTTPPPAAGIFAAAPVTTGTLTARGLPQRVPRAPGLSGEPTRQERERERQRERERGGQVDPQDLRRKLGGLQRGLLAGRRDAENEVRGTQGDTTGPAATVEEATR